MKEEDILGKNVIVVANLKARNMQGIKSHGMLLAASNETHDKVELLVAPENAKLGSRVVFGDAAFNGEPASANQVQKKKYWEAFGPELVTNGEMEASWKEDGAVMRVELEGEEGEGARRMVRSSVSLWRTLWSDKIKRCWLSYVWPTRLLGDSLVAECREQKE